MRLGIDLGGTKIEIIALDEGGGVLLRRRVPTPREDYAGTVAAIAGLVAAAEAELGRRGTVGIGIPGAESRATGLVKNANSTWLIGRPLRQDLETALGREVRIENDANCFALSEATDGAAAGAEVVFGVILGTGVGGGLVVRGQTLVGANAIAGEWGHNPMPGEHHRPECYCGRKGCIELYLSGPGMAKDHRRATMADQPEGRRTPRSGGSEQSEGWGEAPQSRPEEIVARAAAGDPDCEETLVRYERRLARALATVINVVDPDVIVLGGGLSNIDRLYENVPKLWGAHVFSDHVATRLVRNRHGDSSGVRGAAWLWH